jgi:PiT family inorganic phosphate transporter
MAPVLYVLIALALSFDFLNGIHDSSNIVATMITSRAFTPRVALGVTATAEFIAPFVFGVAVAKTIGQEIVAAEAINVDVILAALIAAIVWNLLTWFLGLPSSSSHALIGGIIGAVGIAAGLGAIELKGLGKVLVALLTSTIIGLIGGFLFTRFVFFLCQGVSPRINWFFKRFQIVTALALAFSHGTNDAQKTMGIITLGLVTTGYLRAFIVPTWVIALSAGAISTGIALGGWRLIRTLGGKFYRIQPVHGFSAQMTSALVILGASLVGGPVSTTQVVSGAILGVGAAERVNKVRWGVASEILVAWLITIPATALVAALVYWLISRAVPLITLLY